MKYRQKWFLATACLLSVMSACGGNESTEPAVTVPAVASKSAETAAPGKPSAPISFRYEVQGNPVVGQPVAVNVFVSSSTYDRPIMLSYRVNDASSVVFPESQARQSELIAEPDNGPKMQQITVIPQREGRLYVNVSAEIETPDGTMIKTTAIPIQVGSAPRELETNGDLVETEEGETVISMPAEQT